MCRIARLRAYLLFDLRSDPAETRNLAGLPEHAESEGRLERLLEETVEQAR